LIAGRARTHRAVRGARPPGARVLRSDDRRTTRRIHRRGDVNRAGRADTTGVRRAGGHVGQDFIQGRHAPGGDVAPAGPTRAGARVGSM